MDTERKIVRDIEETPEQPSGRNFVEESPQTAMEAISFYNSKEIPPDMGIRERAAASLAQNLCVEFIQFSCPRINAGKLSTEEPEEYILTDPKGNNFESTSGRLAKLIKELNKRGVPSMVNIILVDTDEADYVFPVLGTPPGFDAKKAEAKKEEYFQNLTKNISGKYSGWLTYQPYRWSGIAIPDSLPLQNIPENDLTEETARLKELFSKGNYYDGYMTPSPENLQEIAELKFRAYANQGYQIARFFPYAILIQNEFPLRLRTRMLNLLNSGDSVIPAIYPYGKSESPY